MQYCTFTLDSMVLGVNVESVQEAIRFQPMTVVPLAPPVVRGLLNLRGQIVTAIDLRTRFGLDARPECVQPMNVVIRCADGVISLLVDQIGDVVDADEEAFEPIPDTLTGVGRDLISGAYKLDTGLLLVLDVVQAVQPALAPN